MFRDLPLVTGEALKTDYHLNCLLCGIMCVKKLREAVKTPWWGASCGQSLYPHMDTQESLCFGVSIISPGVSMVFSLENERGHNSKYPTLHLCCYRYHFIQHGQKVMY